MKIFVPTRGVGDRIISDKQLAGHPQIVTWVADGDESGFRLRKLFRERGHNDEQVVVCPTPDLGLGRIGWIRDWVQDNLADEWYCMIDDNTEIWKLPDPWYQKPKQTFQGDNWDIDFRKLYRTPATFADILRLQDELQAECERVGTTYAGLNSQENYFFRYKKWRHTGFLGAKFCIMKQDFPWVYDPAIQVFSDWARTVRTVHDRGCVVINAYCHNYSILWQSGGIGTLEQRKPGIKSCFDYLLSQYGDLIEYGKETWQLRFKRRVVNTIRKQYEKTT